MQCVLFSSKKWTYFLTGPKAVMKKFVKFTGKHLCWSLFSIKLITSWKVLLIIALLKMTFYEKTIVICDIDDIWISLYQIGNKELPNLFGIILSHNWWLREKRVERRKKNSKQQCWKFLTKNSPISFFCWIKSCCLFSICECTWYFIF